jgi:hypothetical protein
MYILGYIICGIVFEVFLLWEQVDKYDDYEFTIMDLFVGLSIILLWPLAMFVHSFKEIVSFSTVLFRLKKRS